jgi:indolepyruvate ferredoxin oxidoreductase beta subunit
MMRQRITIAILALGGQGGGVLADWLVSLAEKNGYFAQATSVPGVAQRTGSTVYYVEIFPEQDLHGREPVLALMPAPSDVDVVIASELMEAGRAILRGFVAKDRTTLITSTHRIYSIAEKSAQSGGLADGRKILEAAERNAKFLVAFDMDAAAERTKSAISAVMLGAIAASGTLPFARGAYEETIQISGIAVDANLAGFAAGFESRAAAPTATAALTGDALVEEGARRLIDYQDEAYAALYRQRLEPFSDPAVKYEMARALALWMSYEDVMRVAQQKVRASRMDKVRAEVNAQPDQILHVTEYMHPRWQELCDTLPAGVGARLARGGMLKRSFAPLFEKGRHVRTTNVFSFLALRVLASHRRKRRGTLRYREENARIETWLAAVRSATATDCGAALELARCQNLIKGYGETHARGLRKFDTVMQAYDGLRTAPDAADRLRQLREAAQMDEEGIALQAALHLRSRPLVQVTAATSANTDIKCDDEPPPGG